MSEVVPIRKTKFEEYRKLLEDIKPVHVMVICMGEDGRVKLIPSPLASNAEMIGWMMQAVAKLSNS